MGREWEENPHMKGAGRGKCCSASIGAGHSLGVLRKPGPRAPEIGSSVHGERQEGVTSREAAGRSPGPAAHPHVWVAGGDLDNSHLLPWAALPAGEATVPTPFPSSSVSLLFTVCPQSHREPRTADSPMEKPEGR